MPNIKSAKKRVKTDAKKKVANKNNASSMRTAIKKVRAEIKNENKEVATAKFNEANKKIDKAVKDLQEALNPLKDLTFIPFSAERKIYTDNAWSEIEKYI